MKFTHLHVHSHFSILDGMSKIEDLVDESRKMGMNAIALTDHGNMYGIKNLLDYCKKVNGKLKEKSEETGEPYTPFKPIAGVEAYCARRSLGQKDPEYKRINPETGKEVIVDRSGWHLILLAKNKTGYLNLCKIVSISWIDGFYMRPRIDHKLLEENHEGIICCSACIGGEIPQKIMAGKLDEAEESVRWFKSVFGEDYYLEIQRHQTDKPNSDHHVYEMQQKVNPILLELGRKCGVKVICTNDVHFVKEEHGEAHDRLICLSTGKNVSDVNRMHYTKQEWLKSPEQMAKIFQDLPEVLENTQEIVDKVEVYNIDSDPIMPKFPIPEDFGTEEEYRQRITEQDLFDEFTRDEHGQAVLSQEDAEKKIKKLGGYDKLYRIKLEADYLNKLAWDGARKRYGEELSDELKERILFELHIMKTMGFPGYFLIVRDYIRAAREELGVSVGPGRGSAAGSVVAYCLWITDVDPMKYDLLFERFLNPDRISLPDIDVDFDDDGRARVLDYVTEKYGADHVAHIITYGSMATKSSIKDVGRVQGVPLPVVQQAVNLIPDKFPDTLKDPMSGKVPKVNVKNCFKYVPELDAMRHGQDPNVATMLEYAAELEGTNRQVGIHACGVIIGADDLKKFAPMATVKDKDTGKDVLVTEYDGHVVEQVGLIKMDFLGLSTLSIIKEVLKNIKRSRGEDVDIDHIPIDDPETFELFRRGDTVAVFQFESPGMRKNLRELQPTVFEDLIAMNALYRPGPMDYIPDFIDRKLGRKPIEYDIPVMEKYLKDTYGVTVYQEQVMLLSRLLANFTRGESDKLRKAMGKKQLAILEQLKGKFMDGGQKNGHPKDKLEKIWADWVKFASYAFNKSHATCYSWVAYQTAYLKAHYPAEYMAGNLTRNKDNATEIAKLMDECKHMGIRVLSPDVNESELDFTVNQEGNIRFGMGGIKGVGEGAVEAILQEREQNGPFQCICDLLERVNLTACNRKALENLAFAGAFDCFKGEYREQYFVPGPKDDWIFEDVLLKYGQRYQADQEFAAGSLFGGENAIEIPRPTLNRPERWSTLYRLNKEKELVGMYLSAHPLDEHKFEIVELSNIQVIQLDDLLALRNRTVRFGGMITDCREGTSKKGNPYGVMTVTDYSGAHEIPLFGRSYTQFRNYLQRDTFVSIQAQVILRGSDSRWGPPKDIDQEDKQNWMLSLKAITQLNDEEAKALTRNLTIDLSVELLTPDLTAEISEYIKASGPHPTTDLFFRVYDQGRRHTVEFQSKDRITVTQEFYKFLTDKRTENSEIDPEDPTKSKYAFQYFVNRQ